MKRNGNNKIQEKPIFMIEDSDNIASSQEILEEPIITIESDYDMASYAPSVVVNNRSKVKMWCIRLLWLIAIIVIVLSCYGGIRLYEYYFNIGVSISVSPRENIKKLDGMKAQNGPSEIVLKQDSVLGVALNIYELHNVKAEITLEKPDTTDRNVLMYTRSSDYTAAGEYIGSLVIDGDVRHSGTSRLGYCAITGGNMVIGISRFDSMKDYVADHGGSYFRQFVLVSNGELPQRFFLHGKVDRKALARAADDRLCIVGTRHPETLWDFADALREYGYVDAIYLTGGNDYGFYRASDGTSYFSEKAVDKHDGVAPWLVLKKN